MKPSRPLYMIAGAFLMAAHSLQADFLIGFGVFLILAIAFDHNNL